MLSRKIVNGESANLILPKGVKMLPPADLLTYVVSYLFNVYQKTLCKICQFVCQIISWLGLVANFMKSEPVAWQLCAGKRQFMWFKQTVGQ